MHNVDVRTGLRVMDRSECLEMLAADNVGRLAVVVGGAPTIFPVNYVLDGEIVTFRTDPGTKLDHGPRTTVAFEIDHLDRGSRTGWSVVVTGRLEELDPVRSKEWARSAGLGIDPWAGGAKDHIVRLVPTRITGRAVGAVTDAG